jgi:hypothetical protein
MGRRGAVAHLLGARMGGVDHGERQRARGGIPPAQTSEKTRQHTTPQRRAHRQRAAPLTMSCRMSLDSDDLECVASFSAGSMGAKPCATEGACRAYPMPTRRTEGPLDLTNRVRQSAPARLAALCRRLLVSPTKAAAQKPAESQRKRASERHACGTLACPAHLAQTKQ